MHYSSIYPRHRELAMACVMYKTMEDPLKYGPFAKVLWQKWGTDDIACFLVNWGFLDCSDIGFSRATCNYLLDANQKRAVLRAAGLPYVYDAEMAKSIMM